MGDKKVEVKELEFNLAGEDGEFLWIRFKLKNGAQYDSYYFKGGC